MVMVVAVVAAVVVVVVINLQTPWYGVCLFKMKDKHCKKFGEQFVIPTAIFIVRIETIEIFV
jgi:hypothetical protein